MSCTSAHEPDHQRGLSDLDVTLRTCHAPYVPEPVGQGEGLGKVSKS